MTKFQQRFASRVQSIADWFIPARLKARSDVVQGVRMFLFSHMFGPFLGHTISISMLVLQGQADLSWWIFFGAVTLFWLYPIFLRVTGCYTLLALISIQNLLFCILWGCYHYGGISSPILPWLITVPLLAFLYLPAPKTRITVLFMIGANLIAFYFIYSSFGFPATVPLAGLVILGLVSTFCAGVYVSMMALYYSNIVSSQVGLEREIKHQHETELQLRAATEQVERAIKAKSEYLARMGHELRNPLNAIIGYSELLVENSTMSSGQRFEDLMSIKSAGDTLLRLVNDLLDLSKLDAGKMELCLEPFSVVEFTNDLAVKWQLPIAQSGNELHVECPPELGDIIADASKLRQAVSNLLSNAAKFTKHGRIRLTVSKEDDLVLISVKDTGVGIPPEQMANLFETFGRQDHETSSNYGEYPGLGLPLTYRLCRLMAGDLIVKSNLGHGSSFTIRVPSRLFNCGEGPVGHVPLMA